jgi:pimeloyl-ACP methyl ester carboxylesterase
MSRLHTLLFFLVASVMSLGSQAELFANPLNADLGVHRLSVESLGAQDKKRIDLDYVYLQLAWSLYNYPRISKFQVNEARPTELSVTFQGRHRKLPVVELRHPAQRNKTRKLVVMSSGLFASEWDDLNSAKWFFDQGYDVLKLPTGLNESFVRAFPWVSPGDLRAEAEIIKLSITAYSAKYELDPGTFEVVGFGSSYGASVMLKLAERFPDFFDRVIATGPVYDFAYSVTVFDSLMKAKPQINALDDAEKGRRFLMSKSPQLIASEEYETYAKFKIAEFMLKKVRLYCWIQSAPKDQKNCLLLESFAELMEYMNLKMPADRLAPTQNPRVYVLTTLNDPLNRAVVPVGRTRALEKGGHFGFLGTDTERQFILNALQAR